MTDSSPDDDAQEENAAWAEFNEKIRALLDKHRPNRSIHNEKGWREPVYGWARNHIPDESNLIRHYAEREVDSQERTATLRGNRLLRQWAKGQRPLIWSDLGALPIVVGGTRVRLDSATPDDIEDAALELHAKGKATYDEVVLLTETLHELARSARRAGFATVALIGDQPPRDGEDTADAASDDEDEDW